jgi:hypothetical protein
LFKGLIKQNSSRAKIHTALVSEQLTEFPGTQKNVFLHKSGSELPLEILQTWNFRNESETGSTLDSGTPKSIGLLAKSQVASRYFKETKV